MGTALRDFFTVLAGTAGVLGVVYIGLVLLFGQVWIDANALVIFTHGFYLLLVPPAIWMFRFRPELQSEFRSPTVKAVLDGGILVTEPCPWMGYRATVSVFKIQDDVEMLVFSAYVLNIQSNKLVQISPTHSWESQVDIGQLRASRDKLLIKPGHVYEQ